MIDRERELNREILRGNLERNHADLKGAEQQKALTIALEAFRGMTGNGEAADIGAAAVRRLRQTGQ